MTVVDPRWAELARSLLDIEMALRDGQRPQFRNADNDEFGADELALALAACSRIRKELATCDYPTRTGRRRWGWGQ